MSVNRSLIAPTSNPALEQALRHKIDWRAATIGSLGELEALALQLGLIQNTLTPQFSAPQLVIFAADHGLAVEGLAPPGRPTTAQLADQLLRLHLPVAVLARLQGLELSMVDCGVAEPMAPHPRLLARKIAHATRNARVSAAMTLDQAHAAIRAGMEIGDALAGNALACAGLGVGANQSAAMVLSRLSGTSLSDLLIAGPEMEEATLAHLLTVLNAALTRHKDALDPVEVLAAFGGFEVAVMVGAMLVAGSKRRLIIVDGMPACAALLVASRIAPAVVDYCVFCRSHKHRGLDQALKLFNASALLELGMESADGTGATLAWPLLRSAAALLTELVDADDALPIRVDPGADVGVDIGANSEAAITGHPATCPAP